MGKKVLIVDDEIDTTRLLERCLKLYGFEDVRCAYEPNEAMKLVDSFKPDIVFLDINLDHEIDGLAVLLYIRQVQPIARVCMTSAYREQYVELSLQQGAQEFLGKPHTLDDFVSVAQKLSL